MLEHSLAADILGSYYKSEHIHTQNVVPLNDGKIELTFQFPPYERTVADQGHVGMSQMHEALVEGLYCTIGYAIERQHVPAPITLQTFIRRMAEALFMRESLSFRKMLKAGESATLTMKIGEAKEVLRQRYYSVTVHIDGFMRGEAECWLPIEQSES